MILLLAAAGNLFSAATPNLSQAEKSAANAATAQAVQEVASGGAHKGVADVMVITPGERANDIVQSFNYIQSHDVTAKYEVKLKDGNVLSHILDIQMMPSGTLLVFKMQTMKGEVFRVIKIENISEVMID